MKRWFPVGLALAPALSFGTVRYEISPNLAKQAFEVSIKIDHPKSSETFAIPGWSPGFYTMLPFAQKISDVKATSGATVDDKIEHPDDNTWTVSPDQGKPLEIDYTVKADDVGLGFFAASISKTQAYTNGAASFLYFSGRKDEDVSLVIDHPDGWKVATALKRSGAGLYSAKSYDEFVDDPIQIGNFDDRKFEVEGIPFEAVFVPPDGEGLKMDEDAMVAMLKKIGKPAIDLFHGAPFDRYIFFFHLTGLGFQGGLEHRSGTVIAIPNENDDLSDLAAHEYFHAWNVKQIRPVPSRAVRLHKASENRESLVRRRCHRLLFQDPHLSKPGSRPSLANGPIQ